VEEIPAVVGRVGAALACRLPVSPGHAPVIRALYADRAPKALAAMIESADNICNHVFDILGSGPVALGDVIDWHLDFKSGHRWDARQFYLDFPPEQSEGVDIKVPWELSRGHHLVLLAQTALLTGETKYSTECMAQMTDWIAANRPGFGVNWVCPMDVAIRAVNWLWALALLSERPNVSEIWMKDILAALVTHGRFLMANLEIRDDGVTTNHYLADIVGLLYLGCCLKEVRDAEQWRAFAIAELAQEIERQVLPDGVHYESSLSYHRLVTEMFLSSAMLCRRHALDLPPAFYCRLEKMCEFVKAYTKPNGLAPQVGDGDNGRLHLLTGYGQCDVRDHRHLLAVGALLFDRADWLHAAGPSWVEQLWFGGPASVAALQAKESAPLAESRAFPDGGFYILRRHEDFVLFNCNPPGTKGVGTHKHNDLLSLDMQLGGEDILVDPGCFLYTSDPQAYNRFRSTIFHSTIRIDTAEQNRLIPGKLFCLHPDSRLQVLASEIGQPMERVVAEHNGYGRLSDPVRHRREVRHDQHWMTWLVIDRLTSDGGRSDPHRLEWTLVFAPQCSLHREKDGWRVVTSTQQFWLEGPRVSASDRPVDVQPQVEPGEIAPQYGVTRATSVLRWTWEGPLPVEGTFMLSRLGAGSCDGRSGVNALR
jgi:hypothetical protein